jgi:hypothetical protein
MDFLKITREPSSKFHNKRLDIADAGIQPFIT